MPNLDVCVNKYLLSMFVIFIYRIGNDKRQGISTDDEVAIK